MVWRLVEAEGALPLQEHDEKRDAEGRPALKSQGP